MDIFTTIPANIFQTWHTKNLPPLMFNAIQEIKNQNPNFLYRLFDDNDCRNFIERYFDDDVLYAFDNLVPGAYKADLFRYCILYKLGGIYLDIKYIPIKQFKLLNLLKREHWVLDADNKGVYNALMVCKQGNPILLKAIRQIVVNVKSKYYGENSLYPTGPRLLGFLFTKNQKDKFDMKHIFKNVENGRFIALNNNIIFKTYNGYLKELDENKKVLHYSSLWDNKEIYK